MNDQPATITAGMTPARLAELQGLAEAATPGPWTAHDDGLVWRADLVPSDPVSGSTELGDAAFIAESRTAMPELLAEVERLQATTVADEAERWAAQDTIEQLTDEMQRLRHQIAEIHAPVDTADDGVLVCRACCTTTCPTGCCPVRHEGCTTDHVHTQGAPVCETRALIEGDGDA